MIELSKSNTPRKYNPVARFEARSTKEAVEFFLKTHYVEYSAKEIATQTGKLLRSVNDAIESLKSYIKINYIKDNKGKLIPKYSWIRPPKQKIEGVANQRIAEEISRIAGSVCSVLTSDSIRGKCIIEKFQKKNKVEHRASVPLSEIFLDNPKEYDSLMKRVVILTGHNRDIVAKVITGIMIEFYPFGWCFRGYPYGKIGNDCHYHIRNVKEMMDYLFAGGKLEDLFKPVKESSKD